MERPNILILHTDQQRWDALGAAGNPDIRTPNLDRLCRDGIQFDHCFCQNPVCMPSRVSFLTGQYPSALGLQHMGVPVPPQTVTLPRLLKPYGYRTANFGKLHFLPHANRDHREPHPDYGFDCLEIADEPGVYEDAYRAWVRRFAPDQLDALSAGLPPATATWYRTMGIRDTVRHPESGGRNDNRGAFAFPGDERWTHAAFVAERTISFIEGHPSGNPFFCIAGFYSPHSPWIAPQRFLDLYDPTALHLPVFPPEAEQRRAEGFDDAMLRTARQGYYAMVSEVDFQVGRILDALERRGLAENTMVVFTSDHGEWLGEHLRWGKGYPAHDPISRIPLIVRWPEGIKVPGRTVSGIVEAVDVAPTILEAAAIQVPPHLQGASLGAALCQGKDPGKNGALVEHTGWRSFRSHTHRYIARADGGELLFDLEAPWGEYRDIAREPAAAAALSDHRRILLHRLISSERPQTRIWPY